MSENMMEIDEMVEQHSEGDTSKNVRMKKSKIIRSIVAVFAVIVVVALPIVTMIGNNVLYGYDMETCSQSVRNVSQKLSDTLTPILKRYGLNETGIEFVSTNWLGGFHLDFREVDIYAVGFEELSVEQAMRLLIELEDAANALDISDCNVTTEDRFDQYFSTLGTQEIRVYVDSATYYTFLYSHELDGIENEMINSYDGELQTGIYMFTEGEGYLFIA